MAYTSVSTLQLQLTALNQAILDLLTCGSSSYMLGDRQVTKLDLDKLTQMRNDLERKIDILENPKRRRITTYGVFKSSR
ncbi:MAG: hypothetical protein ABIJ17_02590 [Patescibacteria group bacterium]